MHRNSEKAFTLIELLAVIVILAVVAVIAFPFIGDIIKASKEKSYEVQVKYILKSAENWVITNMIELSEEFDNFVSLEELSDAGYLSTRKITNPITNKKMNGCIFIQYDEEKNNFQYSYNENDCSVYEKIFITNAEVVYDDSSILDDDSTSSISILEDSLSVNHSLQLMMDSNSFVTYKIKIYNNTRKSYKFQGVDNSSYDNENIVLDEVSGMSIGDILYARKSVTFTVKFHYKDYILDESNILNSNINFNFIKSYAGSYIYNMVEENSVADNISSDFVSSSDGIDFSSAAGDENGKGVYTLADTLDYNYPVHYYRGNVDTNNVIFGNYCWKIVRTTDTGGTKLVYNGVPVDGKCNSTGFDSMLAKGIKFNTSGKLEASGYSYGGSHTFGATTINSVPNGAVFANDVTYKDGKYVFSDDIYVKDSNMANSDPNNILKTHHYTCLKTIDETCTTVYFAYMLRGNAIHYIKLNAGEKVEDALKVGLTNTTNGTVSTIRKYIDEWYSLNMTDFTKYLEDTVWCNDRSIFSVGGWSNNGEMLDETKYKLNFSGNIRMLEDHKPSIVCKNPNDRFTVSKKKGNGKLTYPVALLTLDEAALAGYVWFVDSGNNYLNIDNKIWWTMTPTMVSAGNVYMGIVYSILDNVHSAYTSNGSGGVRPSISLKHGVKISDGFGTADDPFTIKEI